MGWHSSATYQGGMNPKGERDLNLTEIGAVGRGLWNVVRRGRKTLRPFAGSPSLSPMKSYPSWRQILAASCLIILLSMIV